MIFTRSLCLVVGLFAVNAAYSMQQPKQSTQALKKWFERAAHGLEDSSGRTAQQKCEDVIRYGKQLLEEKITKVPDLGRPGSFISVEPKMETAQELLDAMKSKGSRRK